MQATLQVKRYFKELKKEGVTCRITVFLINFPQVKSEKEG